MRKHLLLTSFFVGFLLFNYQDAFAQPECLGLDGSSGIGGGVTRIQNGVVCTNLDVPGPAANGGILQIQATNVRPGDVIEYRILWNDGSPFTAWIPIPATATPGINQINSAPHFFPTTGTQCEFTPSTFIRFNNGGVPVVCNPGTFGIAPVFFRWNREGNANSPSSNFVVTSIASPNVVAGLTNVEVCAGVATTVTFQDLSDLNCNTFPGDVTISGNRNNSRRWRQYEYGGAGVLNNIVGGVTVGATPVAAGANLFGTLMTYDAGPFPALAGAPAGAGGGLDGPNTAAAFGVPVSTTTVQTLAITVPATAVVGNTFVVTTHYWNNCNRNDLGNASIPYNLTKITVVGQPAAPNAVAAAAVCNGTTRGAMSSFNISGTPGNATVRWYANTTAAVPAVPGTVGAFIATTTASAGGNSNIAFSTAFPGAAGTVMPANNYIVWATYIGASGSITCESLPVAITRSVRENLDISAQTITPVINVNLCPGSSGHTYTLSMPAAPNAQPVGGNTEYSWSVPAGWTITGGQLSKQITVSVTAGAVAGNIGVVWRYTSVPLCTSGTLNLAVAPLVVPTAPAPTGVNTICEDDNTTFTSAVTGSGITMRWQVDADGAGPGLFANIGTIVGDAYTGETTNALLINAAGLGLTLNGAIYQLVVTGTCGNVTSPTRTLTVNQKATITVQPVSAPNICVNGTKVFTVTATGAGVLSYSWDVDADGAGPGPFVPIGNIVGDPYSGESTASLTINTTGTGTTLTGSKYRVNVNSSLCPTATTSAQAILTLQGPTTTITTPAASPASNCVGSDLSLLATETFLNGVFVSRAWTGTYDETGAPPLFILNNAQLDALLTNGAGVSRRTQLNPIFNSNGLGVNKQGAYVLTLTTTDDNACTNTATITINAGQVTAGILYGPTPGTATNNNLNATVCSATNLFLNGSPTGGSGTYTTHTWTVVAPPATPIGTVLTAGSTTATPTFNFSNTTAANAVFVLRYFVQDNGGCNFTTGAGTDITITVNPQPVVANQPIAALCSRVAVGANFNASTSVAAATYNVTVLNLNGLTVSAGGAAVANGLANTALADDAFSNTTNAQVNVVYTVVPVSGAGCAGNSFTVTVPVDPQPVVAVQTPAAVCSRSPVGVNFSASTSVAAATYNVTVLNLNGLTVAAGGAAVANGLAAAALADDAFNNTTAGQVNVVYTVTPVSAAGCNGASFTVTVPVNPEPVVAAQPIAALCSRTAVGVNFNASTSVAAATYNVTVLTLNGLTVAAGGAAVANGLANTALADDAFNNTTNGQVNVVYTVVPVSAAGCTGAAFTVTVPVNPEPVVANQPIPALCSRTAVGVNFSASTSVAAATYNITALTLNGATISAGAPAVGNGLLASALADDAFKNVTGALVNVQYTVVPVSAAVASCTGASFTVTVPVTPEPVIAAPFTKTICSGDPVSYTIALTPAGLPATTVFNWPAPTMSDATVQGTIGTNQPVGTTISDILINLTAAPTTATYNITPSNGACGGAMQPVVITINPVPAVENVIGSASVCVSLNPVVYSVTNFNSGDLTTSYSWKIPAGFNRLSGGGGAVPGGGFGPFTAGDGILVLNFPIVATGQLELIKKNSFGCTTTAIPLTVTSVSAPPVLPISVDPAPYCFNQTGVKFFIGAPNPASTYSWSIAAGAGTISGSSVGPIISVNLGIGPFVTVSVTETNTIGCSTTFTPATILINPVPDVLATPAAQTLCSGASTNIALSTPNGVPGTTYTWTVAQSGVTGASNQAVGVAGPISQALSTLGAAVGTATYTITPSAGGCSGTPVNVVVTVNPLPTVAANPVAPTQCSGVATNIVLSNPNAVAGTQYYWTVVQAGVTGAAGGGTFATPVAGPIAQTLTTTAAAQGTATYTIFPVANGCQGPSTVVVVTVNPLPDVAFTPASQTICSGQNTAIALSTPNGVPGAAYFWTVVQAGVVGATNSGTVAAPVAGPISQSLLTTGSAPGTATYTVTPVAAGCTGTPQMVVITVNPIPNVAAAPPSATICSGATTNVVLTTPNLVAGTQYTWTVVQSNVAGATNQAVPTAGPISQTLTATTAATGSATYTITPIANGCSGTPIDVVVSVNPVPNVLATPGAQTLCSGQSTGIALSNPNAVAGTQYFWTVVQAGVAGASNQGSLISPVNGPISQTLTTTGSVPGTATYTITPVANGCPGTPTSVIVTVNPLPNVVATPASQTICSGGTTGIALSTTNGVAGTQYFWTVTQSGVAGAFASGTLAAPVAGPIAQILTTTISAIGTATYNITPVSNGCPGTPTSVIVTVNPVPVGVPTIMTLCSDVAVGISLNSLVVGGALAASSYDITTISNASGLTASAGAPSTGTGFTATEIQDDKWTNTQGVQRDIIYTIVPISGTVPPCSGTPFTLTVHVDPEPTVAAVLPQSFCPGDAINIPLSSNVVGATMNWTNTNTSIGLAASGTGDIIYAAPANNTGANLVGTITVTAVNAGCTSAGTNIKTFTITIKPTPVMVANSNVVVCSGGNVAAINFSANTGGGETFTWTNSNPAIGLGAGNSGNIASFTAGINITGAAIVGTIGVSASKGGCAGPVSNFTITVNPEPVVNAVVNQSFCPGDPVNIPLTSNVPGATIGWTNSNTSIGAGATGAGDVIYIAPLNNSGINIVGTITVSALANGCLSAGGNQKSFTITIKPSPIMNANANITVCSGGTVPLVTFSANTGGGETFNWTNDNVAIGLLASGTGNIASYTAPVNTTGASIIGNISVTGTLLTCAGPAKTFIITILPQPVGTNTPVTVCSDVAVGVNLSTLITGSLGASTYNITTITNASGLVSSAGVPVTGTGFSATEVQNDKWTNTSGVQHDIIYTIVPVSGASCAGAPFTLTVHVDPEPVVAAVGNVSVCPTAAINIPLTSNVPGATLNWTNTNPTIGIGASGTGDIIYAAPANNTGADLVGTITVSATLNGCTSAGANVKTFTITIKPTPVMAANSNIAVCSGANVPAITFSANTAGGETFNWTNSNIAIGLAASGSGNIATFAAATNTTGAPIVATIGVSATKNLCAGPVSNFTITINPEPVVTPVVDVSACSGTSVAAINFTTNAGGGETFSWTNTNTSIGLAASGFGSIASYMAPNNVSGVDIVGTITVTATKSGCLSAGGNVETFTITIKSQPVGGNDITPIVNSDGVLNYDLQNNVNTLGNTMASTFSWVAANNSNVSGESLVPVATAFINDNLHNVTNTNQSVLYTVTPTSNGCTGAPFFITITVRPEPVGTNDMVTVNSDVNINYNLQNNVNSIGNGLPSTFTWVTTDNPFLTGESLAMQTTATITDIITNTSGVDQVLIYTVTPTGTNGVPGDPFTIQVTIRSEPVGSNDVASICSKGTPNYDLQNNLNTPPGNGQAATFSWFAASNVNVTGESIVPQSGAFITDVLRNFTNLNEVVTYTVTPTGTNSCPGNTFQIVVTVRPEPVLSGTLDNTACSGLPYGNLLNTNGLSIGAATYDVTVTSIDAGLTGGRPLGLIGGGGSAANVIQADTWINTTSVPLKAVYSVVPNGTNGCIGDAKLVTFTINPAPMLASPGFPAVCSTNSSVNNIVNVVFGTNGTSVAAASYELMNIQYSNGGPFGAALPPSFTIVGGNAIIGAVGANDLVRNDRFTNGSNVPVTVRYTVRGTSGAGCVSANLDYDVVVNPEPVLDPLLNPTPVCSGLVSGVTLGVAAGSVGAATYNINSILFPGLTAGGSNTGIGNNKAANAIFNDVYVNTTSGVLTAIYKISPVSAAGCIGPEGTLTLTIQASPDLSNSLNRTVCINTNGGITFSTTGSSVPAVNYNLVSVTPAGGLVPAGGNKVPANGVASNYVSTDQFNNPTNGPLTVTYRVAPVSGATCVGPAEDIILTIEPTITAAPVSTKPTVCSSGPNGNDPTDITLGSPTTPSAGVITYNYTAVSSIGTGITGFTPALSGLAPGYIITDNLVNTSNSPATVTYSITPVAAGASAGAGCTGLPVPIVVTVEPKPKLGVPPVKTVCEGVSIALSLTSTTTPSAGTIEFLLVSAMPSSAMISGASANGSVFANGFTMIDQLNNNNTVPETMTYTFRPRYNGGAGCVGDDVVTVITANPKPTVVPSAQPPICSGDVIDITLTTDVAFTVPIWTVTPDPGLTGASGGAGDRIFQILFNNTTGTGPLNVVYHVTPSAAGCAGAVVDIPVVVNPLAKVIGTPTTVTVCHGAALNVPLSSNVTAGVTYSWTIVDSSGGLIGGAVNGSGGVINQVLTNTTGAQATLTYTISPTGPGPCPGQDKLMIVTVSPEVTASWLNTPSPDFICKGSTEYLVLNIGGRAPFNFTYNDGGAPIVKTGQPPVAVLPHVPLVTTTYTLTSITDGLNCTVPFNVPFVVNVGDTDPNYTIVNPVPAASCSPNKVTFQYNQVAGTIYTWRFGDSPDSVYTAATTVANKQIKHTYTNLSPTSTLNYPVTMQTELPAPYPGCFKTTPAKTVTIYPNVITNVIPNNDKTCSGDLVTFMNSSVGTNSQTWSYSVGGGPETVMGTTFNMNFAFTNNTTSNPLTYDVVFRATNGLCPAPDLHMFIDVYRNSVANFSEGVVPLFMNGESLVTFTNTSSIVDAVDFTYDWVFGPDANPPNSTSDAPGTIQYTSPGPKDITLTVTNKLRAQCKSSFTKEITILLPPLIAMFDVNPKESCFPSKISVSTDPSITQITGDVIEWKVVDQNNRTVATSSGVFPEFQIPAAGDYTVLLTTKDSQTGQTATAAPVNVSVYGQPFASFDARPDVVFVPDTEMIIFNFSTDPQDLQFTWDFGDGDKLEGPAAPSTDVPVPDNTHNGRTKGTYDEPTHFYKVEGLYDLTLYASFDHGGGVVCTDTLKQQVQARQGGVTKVPNAFTPSTSGPSGGQAGSGTFNDVFLPIVKGADEFNLQIYDRWGNMIFESNSSQTGWDGYSADGKLLPAGVYVYKLTVRLSDGQRSTQIGDITMIR